MSQEFQNFNLDTENQGDTVQKTVPPMGFTQIFTSDEFEKYKEKKELRRTANAAGLSSTLLFVFSLLLSIVFGIVIMLIFGKNGDVILQDPATQQALQIVFSLLAFTVPFIIIYKLFGNRISDLVPFSKTPSGMKIPIICMGLGMCAFANIGASYIDSVFKSIGIDYSNKELAMPEGILGFILATIATAAVPALVEEFAMRGIVLGSLRKFGDGFALITSSLVFGIMHGNFTQIPFAFMVGIFLGFAVIKTGSLRISIIIHFINNFVSVLFSYLPSGFSEELANTLFAIYLMFCLAIAIFGIFKTRNDKSFFKMEDVDTKNGTAEKYKTFFTSPAVTIFMILSLLQAILYIFI